MDFLYWLYEIRTPILEKFFSAVTYLGSTELVVAAICLLYWCVKKELAYRVTFGFFLSGLLVQGLKITFRIPRPWVLDPSFQPVASAVPAATGYSFPSGHTQSATSVYGSIALFAKRKWLKIVMIVLFVTVGFSRMYLGVHTPLDVFTSMGITLVIIVVVQQISKIKFTSRLRILCATLIAVFSLVLLFYSLGLRNAGIINDHYAADSLSAAMAGISLAIGWLIESTWIQFSEKTKNVGMQVVKFVIGLSITLFLKYLIGLLTEGLLLSDGIINFIVILWIIAGYPLIIKKWFSVRA